MSGSDVLQPSVPQAEFTERTRCIACAGPDLSELARGRFTDPPLRGFIEGDPWGEPPLPHLQHAEWVLKRCRCCGQVFHGRILTPEWNEHRFSVWMSAAAIAEFEAREASAVPHFEAGRRQVAHVLRLERLTRSLRAGGPLRLLDFGCGSGSFLVVCQQFGLEACGVDRSAARAERARGKIFRSLAALPEEPRFHAITLFEVLEHLDNPGRVLGELAGRIVPGGILVLETPDCSGVNGIQTLEDYRSVHPLDHINAFTRATLIAIAERHGFVLIPRGAAFVTADPTQLLRTAAKHGLRRDARSTQLYFRRRWPA